MAPDNPTNQKDFWPDLPVPKKRCARCKRVKPLSEFYGKYRRRSGKVERHSYCKECHSRYTSSWRADPAHADGVKKAQRKYDLKRQYGLTHFEYKVLLENQGGCCAICKTPPGDRHFHIDHDHKTGAIRGLLCNGCNTGIGLFREDPVRLLAAVEYLKTPPPKIFGRHVIAVGKKRRR